MKQEKQQETLYSQRMNIQHVWRHYRTHVPLVLPYLSS